MFQELLRLGLVKSQVYFATEDGKLVQKRRFFLSANGGRNKTQTEFEISFDPLTGQKLSEMSFDIPQAEPKKRTRK